MRGELSQRGDASAAVAAFWTHTEPVMRRIARVLSDDPDVQDECAILLDEQQEADDEAGATCPI